MISDSDLVITIGTEKKDSTVLHVLFEPISVSRGTKIYFSHEME